MIQPWPYREPQVPDLSCNTSEDDAMDEEGVSRGKGHVSDLYSLLHQRQQPSKWIQPNLAQHQSSLPFIALSQLQITDCIARIPDLRKDRIQGTIQIAGIYFRLPLKGQIQLIST